MGEEEVKEDIAPSIALRDRYIPIEDVEEVCGLKVDYVRGLIKEGKIKYTEFMRKGSSSKKRVVHIDPEELMNYLMK